MVRPLYQERILEVLVHQRDEAKLQIETSDAAFIGGRGSLNDAFAARTAVVQIEDRITMAELQVGTSKIQLHRWSSARANADSRMGARAAKHQELSEPLAHCGTVMFDTAQTEL